MNKNILSILAFVLYLTASFAQSDIDGYKYVIVPNNYDFLKGEDDKYKLNSLTIFLFDKYGFNAFFEDEDYPQDLLINPCLGVQVQIRNNSKLFTTRLVIELKDCYNKVVYSSIEGSTREKNYEKAYQESLRGAFVSFQAMNYSFDPALVTNLSVAKQTDKPVTSEIAKNENDSSANKEIVAAPAAVVSASAVTETKAQNEPQKKESASTELSNTEVAAVPIVVTETTSSDPAKGAEESVLKSYKNDTISFFLIELVITTALDADLVVDTADLGLDVLDVVTIL